MFIKKVFGLIVMGATVELGSYLMKKSIELASDPYKRAVVKQKAKKIKNTIFDKKEVP